MMARGSHGFARRKIAAYPQDMRALSAVLLVLIAGCAATPDRYQIYLESVRAQAADDAAQRAAIASAAAACRDDRCVEHVAALAAIAVVAGKAGVGAIAPPPREPTAAEQAAQIIGAASPIAAAIIGYHSTRHSTRAATEQHAATWSAVADIVGVSVGAARDVAVGAVGRPQISVDGDWVAGDRVTVGGDQIGRDRTEVTVGGDVVGRDRIAAGRDITGGNRTEVGGDQIGGDQQIGDRAGRDVVRGSPIRWYSPDDRSGDCRDGADCWTIPPPESGGGP